MTPVHSDAAAAVLKANGVGAIATVVILGTGLGAVATMVEAPITVPYADLPGFPAPTVTGHAGQLVVGTRAGVRIAFMMGRGHFYETGNPAVMAPALATLGHLGAGTLLITCAAGSVRADIGPGSVALITDHINLSGTNPLIGATDDERFVDMVDAYDPALRQRLRAAASARDVELHEAVYMWFSGPSFETPAEIRMARHLGADVVGMSLVPEVILARRLGLRVAGLAVITNFGAGFSGGAPSHGETQTVARTGGVAVSRLLDGFFKMADDARPTAGGTG